MSLYHQIFFTCSSKTFYAHCEMIRHAVCTGLSGRMEKDRGGMYESEWKREVKRCV